MAAVTEGCGRCQFRGRVQDAADNERQDQVADSGGAGADKGIQLELELGAQRGGDVAMEKRQTSAMTFWTT